MPSFLLLDGYVNTDDNHLLLMEMILFIGIPGSGKSSFYKKHFFNTHIRINLDMLRTRNREKRLLDFCFTTNMPLVIDNTNVKFDERKEYIQAAKVKGFKVKGYFFRPVVKRSIALNKLRQGKEKVADVAIFSKKKHLEIPQYKEGFDELYSVNMDEEFVFHIKGWEASE